VRKDKYEAYRVELSADAGNKVIFSEQLTGLHGSIRVETPIVGADVYLDPDTDQGGSNRKAVTPAVFDDVRPGAHVVQIGYATVGKRLYTVGDPIQVEVKPGEPTVVSRTFVEGKAHLTVTDAPAGSVLEIDGRKMESGQELTAGVEVPAGTLDVAIDGPNSQKWTGSISPDVGGDVKQSIYSMKWHLARRTIAMDGEANAWEGLLPVWIPEPQTAFPDQPGTTIERGFACRDDTHLYFKYEFANGSPRLELSKVFNELDYVQIISTYSGQVRAITKFHRTLLGGSSTSTTLGLQNPGTRSWLGLGNNVVKFRIGADALEIAVPLRPILAYVKGDFMTASMNVVNARSSDGNWLAAIRTETRVISFDF